MRSLLISLSISLLAGCSTQTAGLNKASPLRPLAAAAPTKFAETRYDVQSYRDAENPALRHAAHTIYRRTVVSAKSTNELETVPRTSYPPTSVQPLPASDELAAELAKQKTITAELRATQTSVVEIERKMQAQYATLVRQSAEALRLREQLEAERQQINFPSSQGAVAATSAPMANNNPAVKW